jgi:hypothetical protein
MIIFSRLRKRKRSREVKKNLMNILKNVEDCQKINLGKKVLCMIKLKIELIDS